VLQPHNRLISFAVSVCKPEEERWQV
jgi:hypothetical protein